MTRDYTKIRRLFQHHGKEKRPRTALWQCAAVAKKAILFYRQFEIKAVGRHEIGKLCACGKKYGWGGYPLSSCCRHEPDSACAIQNICSCQMARLRRVY